MFKIKRQLILDLLKASSNLFPLEFFSMLAYTKDKNLIDEYVVVPSEYSQNSVSIKPWLVPFDRKIVGTLHSHPNSFNKPSLTDLQNFAKFGEIHLITCPPFDLDSFSAFDNYGNRLELEVVD